MLSHFHRASNRPPLTVFDQLWAGLTLLEPKLILCFFRETQRGPRVQRLFTGKNSVLMLLTIRCILQNPSPGPSIGLGPRSQIVVVTSFIAILVFLEYPRRGKLSIPPRPMKPPTVHRSNAAYPVIWICFINGSHNNAP
jgi:hypothetical protein